MEKTTQQAYEMYVNLLWGLLHSNCPVDTGNMKYHIRINDNGSSCEIIIDTVPYINRKKGRQVEYAGYTEYGQTSNNGWIRRNSILEAANAIASEVSYNLQD